MACILDNQIDGVSSIKLRSAGVFVRMEGMVDRWNVVLTLEK